MFLSLLAHAILRVFVGLVFLTLAYRHYRRRGEVKKRLAATWPRLASLVAIKLVLFELVVGLMFIAGFYTQIAALLAVLFSLKMLVFHKKLPYPLMPQPMVFWLLIGASLSLFITGAGAFAFDLPL
jgi:uncharacterized membrane protein YphA (DoxX/SURF4 family)